MLIVIWVASTVCGIALLLIGATLRDSATWVRVPLNSEAPIILHFRSDVFQYEIFMGWPPRTPNDVPQLNRQATRLSDEYIIHVEVRGEGNKLVAAEDVHSSTDTKLKPKMEPFRLYTITAHVVNRPTKRYADYANLCVFLDANSEIGIANYRFTLVELGVLILIVSIGSLLLSKYLPRKPS